MRFAVALFFLGFAIDVGATPGDCPLQGLWKSDAARTLADIAAHGMLRGAGVNRISDDYFGHFIHEWTCTGMRGWFDYEKQPTLRPYEIVEQTSESLHVEFLDDPADDMRIQFEGECYKLVVADTKWHEYFCPVPSP